jgi:hypothetical protein
MTEFSHILDWTLLKGSHDFPGPDGGTCINEVAMVAAGFEYRSIKSADDMPLCTSRVIAAYALRLNDVMPDKERQKLILFVARILGTADTPEIERQRLEYLVIQTVRRVLPAAMRGIGLAMVADGCENASTLSEAYAAANVAAAYAAYSANAAAYAAYAANAVANAANAAANAAYATNATNAADAAEVADAAYAANAAANAAADAAYAANAALWHSALTILDGCMRIGRQPDAMDAMMVKDRMDAARQLARA